MNTKNQRLGYLQGWIAAVVNTLLFAVKFWVGLTAGSVSMIADSWHTLSDTMTSLVVVVAFWMAGKKGDKEHPFGHGRAEVIAAIVISAVLGVVGFKFFAESIKDLTHEHWARFTPFSIGVFFISAIVKEGLAQFSFWAGRKARSRSLAADGWHHRSDAIASILIVVGAILGRKIWWIDGALGIGVSILILWAAIEILRDGADALMGEAPDRDLEAKVRDLIAQIAPASHNMHHLHIHRYGDHIEATLHLRMSGDMPLDQAHRIASAIEAELRGKLGIEPTIHVEPLAPR